MKAEEHGSFLGQEPAQNRTPSFREQSIRLEMNVAEVTGCEALLLSTEFSMQGPVKEKVQPPWVLSTSLVAVRLPRRPSGPEVLLGTASPIALGQGKDQEHLHLWKSTPGPSAQALVPRNSPWVLSF